MISDDDDEVKIHPWIQSWIYDCAFM